MLVFGLLWTSTIFAQSLNDHWDYRFGIPGTSYYQGVVAVDPRNGDVYAAGDQFTWAGGVAVHNIAKWTRATGKWSALGTGPETSGNGNYITCMGVNPKNGDLYIGGTFSIVGGVSATNIAMWNGSTWSAVGNAANHVSPTSFAFNSTTGDMYIAGSIGTVGTTAMHHVAKWDGSNWTSLGSGFDQSTNAVAVDQANGNVYVAGSFTQAGGKPITGFARWNGTTWDSIGGSFRDQYKNPGQISSIAVSGGNVYVCGGFTKIGTTEVDYIAKWNGTAWSQIGPTDFSNSLGARTIAVIGNDIYIGGGGYISSNSRASFIARWDGTKWNALGPGINGYASCRVNQIVTYSEELIIAAPQMSVAGSAGAKNYAIWNPTSGTWRALGPMIGVDQYVAGMAVGNHGELYVTGGFLAAGQHASPGIAKWNGTSWEAVSKGLTFGYGWASARRVAVAANGDLFVAGGFTNGYNDDSTKSADCYSIARYSGGKWNPMSPGLDLSALVNDIKISGSNVYVGGKFTVYNNGKIANIARWTGSAWDSLGGGITGKVNSLAISTGGDLYAAGSFTAAGRNNTIKYIARWNGTAWSALGAGVNGEVNQIVFHNNKLYVTGTFSTAGGNVIKGLATWDGTAWDTVSSAVNSGQLIAFQGDTIFLGGQVTIADTTAYLAYFENGNWTPLGSGLDNYNQTNYGGSTIPNSMIVVGSDVYMGGVFNVAGNKPSFNFARWNSGAVIAGVHEFVGAKVPQRFELAQNYPNPFNPTTEIRFTLNSASPVTLTIYDMLGREVATLVNEQMHAGSYSVPWNASNAASGAYFYRLTTGAGVQTRRMTLLK